MRQRYFACDDAPDPQVPLFEAKPSRCKPSTWKPCGHCGRMVCPHKATADLCPDCAKPEAQMQRVVPTYAGEYSVQVKNNRSSYTTQSSPSYYRRKEAAEYAAAMKLAGLKGHVRSAGKWSNGRDWYGRPYGVDGTYWEAWIETTMPTERADRQAFADALKMVKIDVLEAALAEDRESYNRKETIARFSGLL